LRQPRTGHQEFVIAFFLSNKFAEQRDLARGYS